MTPRYGVLSRLSFFLRPHPGYENFAVWSPPSGAARAKREAGRKVEGKVEPTARGSARSQGSASPGVHPGDRRERTSLTPSGRSFSSLPLWGLAARAGHRGRRSSFTGLVISGEFQSATIQNPEGPDERGKGAKTIKDWRGPWRSINWPKILPDRIVMEGGEDSFEVLLHDPRSPKKEVGREDPHDSGDGDLSGPVSAAPPGVPRPTPPAAVMPPASPVPRGGPPGCCPRPATPVPVPRAQGTLPEGIYPSPWSSRRRHPAGAHGPDPGLWRGRRPISPRPSVPRVEEGIHMSEKESMGNENWKDSSYAASLTLLLQLGGTIHCAGPQAQVSKEQGKGIRMASPEARETEQGQLPGGFFGCV